MRSWEIIENHEDGRGRMGFRDETPEDKAYREGYEEGYQAAMQEAGMMGQRQGMGGGYGQRGGNYGQGSSYGQREGGYGERDDYSMMGERRRRDSMGRYR